MAHIAAWDGARDEYVDRDDAPDDGCRLFQAALTRAFLDATATQLSIGGSGVDKAQRARARQWLLRDKLEFPIVCSHAGFDAETIRSRARQFEKNAWLPVDMWVKESRRINAQEPVTAWDVQASALAAI